MNVAELWELSTQFLWDQTYLDGLEQFFLANHVETILDTCGGTGFPSLELCHRGWKIVYADGNRLMVDRFHSNLAARGLKMPAYHSNWLELDRGVPGFYDALLCRGNSLVYIDSWNRDRIQAKVAVKRIKAALRQFYDKLNPGGLLYVDLINRKEFGQLYPLVEPIGQKRIDGTTFDLTWTIHHDLPTRTRTCRSKLLIDGQEYHYTYYSYLLQHKELVALLENAGFVDIQETKIAGEGNYNVFIAKKPM